MATEREHYEELTDRQQAFVDTVAELHARDMVVTDEKIAEGMEKQDHDPYASNTIDSYKHLYENIIDDRTQMIANERVDHKGDEKVTTGENGEPVIDAGYQYFNERPYEETEDDAADADAETSAVPNAASDEDTVPALSDGGDDPIEMVLDRSLIFTLIRTANEHAARRLYRQALGATEGDADG